MIQVIPKICLNMIVKNEAKIIERMLTSVLPLIDTYCICDTGSTDNTISVIQNFFNKHNIVGKIVEEPFVNFGYNRTFALEQCKDVDADYLLLMDADMILNMPPGFIPINFKMTLNCDSYLLFQGSDKMYYKNVRILKNNIGATYWGVTHEYVNTPDNTTKSVIGRDILFINDIGDGGSKSNKAQRDIDLLKKGLEENPNNDRYTFYLANSYRDAGQHDLAIETYKKRIEIGGWVEELWYSSYMIGNCYKNMNQMESAIYYWLNAYEIFPNRIESIFEIVEHYRIIGKHKLSYYFYQMADELRNKYNKDRELDYLFLKKEIYDYKLDYELSVIGYYYNEKKYNLALTSMKVIKFNIDEVVMRSVYSNYKFYSPKIIDFDITSTFAHNMELLKSVGNDYDILENGVFAKSTPSLCMLNESTMALCVRYVNYRINEKGEYINQSTINTKNVIALIDITNPERWSITKSFILMYDESFDGRYVGLEDVRLFSLNGVLMYNANRGIDGKMVVEHGSININAECAQSSFLKIENQRNIEKNWVLFEDSNGQMKCIYDWHPCVIGEITQDSNENSKTFKECAKVNTPSFFKHMRGSTNGIKIGNEIWFICHSVSYEDRRYYYHIFVVLDASTYALKKYTPYFTFEKEKVEYTLGFTYDKNTNEFLIGYSVLDKECKYITIFKNYFDKQMIMV
jgi:tetratricopeptide (TPR) repeat protein